MIIDLILDRREYPYDYNPSTFYSDIMAYGTIGNKITYAMDNLEEEHVKQALTQYINDQGYNHDIIAYIHSVKWLED